MSDRVTSEKLNAAEREQRYWKMKRDALVLRNEYETQNPEMFQGPEKRLGAGKPTPVDQLELAHVRGAAMRMFEKGYSGPDGNSSPKSNVSGDLVAVKGRIIEEMIRQKKDSAYIEDAMNRISPYLDTLALANDNPGVQSILVSKIMSGNMSKNPTHDLIELMQLARQLQPHQPPSDAASLMTATTSAIRTGAELSKNSSTVDPVTLAQMLTQNQAQSHERELQMFERLLDSSQPRSLREQLTDLRDVTDTLGKIGGKEPTEIQMKRLDILAAQQARQFESSVELQKGKQQSAMFENIAGALGKALESPVLREAGRKMAEAVPALGKVSGAVSQVQSNAARSTLDQPLDEVFALKCQTCGTEHHFSRKELTFIESSPTKLWACPRCGASYRLAQQGATDTTPHDDRDQPPAVAP